MKPFATTFAEYRAGWLGFGWVAELWIGRTPFCRLAMRQVADRGAAAAERQLGAEAGLLWCSSAPPVRSGPMAGGVRLTASRRLEGSPDGTAARARLRGRSGVSRSLFGGRVVVAAGRRCSGCEAAMRGCDV